MEDDKLPEITEQIVPIAGEISPVNYIYDDIKAKADTPSLLEQIDEVQNDADYFSGMFNTAQEPKKLSFNEDRININEAYTKLSDGSYITRYDEGFIKGADNEQRYAEDQTKVSKWTNGIGKFIMKTGVNVLGGTLGTVYGALSAITEGNWERVYDNEFYDFLDDQNTKMDNFAANYMTQQEREAGFIDSLGTANFWANDFLGGLSFMTGTVISEALWATATGGLSLTTAAGRLGLKAGKYFNTVKSLTNGVKDAQQTLRAYNRLSSIKNATNTATKFGKAGEIANMLRFTYTGAGFEAGMEARLFQKEQTENFNRDFETLNGRKPTPQERAEFEDNLNKTSNALWATNMALVGTSNMAVLGKALGVTSPFKLPKKNLNKVLFGKGTVETLGESGERVSEAIKRNKIQKTLGFTSSLLKAPFYEGIVEEGGQASFSSAAEKYLTSRYNPNTDVMDVVESVYNGLSNTYGTKEGWKEIGLGALIGLFGSEATNVLSGQGIISEAREALQNTDTQSEEEAANKTQNSGVNVLNNIYATRVGEIINQASEVENASKEFETAQDKGDVIGMANAQSRIMATSVKNAVEYDYLNDQIKDFKTALEMQDPNKLAEHYDITVEEVPNKINELITEYSNLGQSYTAAKEFADYVISNNPKELYEDATEIDVREAKQAIAYQLVMTDSMYKNMQGAFEALTDLVTELSPTLNNEYTEALKKYNSLSEANEETVNKLTKAERRLDRKKAELQALNNRFKKFNQKSVSNNEIQSQRQSDKYNLFYNKKSEIEQQITILQDEVNKANEEINSQKYTVESQEKSIEALERQLDAIDPMTSDSMTVDKTLRILRDLNENLTKSYKFKPRLVEQIIKLSQEYDKGLSMWKRNAETLSDLTDPNLGLKRIGSLIQKKKTTGKTTLEFLERLKETRDEEVDFAKKLQNQITSEPVIEQEDIQEAEIEESEQVKADENPGVDILESEPTVEELTPIQQEIRELENTLKDLVGKNRFLLDNFSNDEGKLVNDKAPTQEEVDKYLDLRNKFKSGDINNLLGRPVDKIGKRIKENSNLTDQEIQQYQDLSQKMLDWRIVTGTNADGISVQDILNKINALKQDTEIIGNNPTVVQMLEMAEQGQSEFSVDIADPDFVNSMDKVNIKQNKIETIISHLALDTIEKNGFNILKVKEVNRGTVENPELADLYEISKEGDTFNILYTQDHHRTIIQRVDTPRFFKGMNIQTVKYNTKTGWGYVFKDGVPMESDFGISLINNPDINILNAQELYKLKPEDKVYFTLNMQDVYNAENITPLIKNGDLETASKLMSIYITNSNGDVLGFLKSGAKTTGSNFNKIRQTAIELLQNRLDNRDITLENLVDDNINSVITLPFETEVEKIFVGTPNIELNPDGTAKVFKIDDKNSDLIVDYGFAVNGEIKNPDIVRKTFIPKNDNTPYVVINHKGTQIAFPVGLTSTTSNIKDRIIDIIDSSNTLQSKITDVITLLRNNNIDPTDFNLGGIDNSITDLQNVVSALDNYQSFYTKKDIDNMSREAFIKASEILINLDKDAFVSPKLKIALSKNLKDTRTNETTKTEDTSLDIQQQMLSNYAVELSKANNESDIMRILMETADESFIKEYIENPLFKKRVKDVALKSNSVPQINTPTTLANLIEDTVDIESADIPLDTVKRFQNEVADLKQNPTVENVEILANDLKDYIQNRYQIIPTSITPDNTYYIATNQTEQEMFDLGYVRVVGDFYKKVDNKYSTEELLEGLYDKYITDTLPSHFNLTKEMSYEQFLKEMPDTPLDIYKKYFNTKPRTKLNKKAVIIGQDNYLREDFKGDFSEFIQQQKEIGSKLYYNVLKHFNITDKGILKSDLLTRDVIDTYQSELGDFYNSLLEYSLINKNIDLDEQSNNIIFVGEVSDINRLEAVNNSNLPKPNEKGTIINENEITFENINDPYIEYNNSVYELVNSNKQNQYLYQKIADINPNFIITNVAAPFSSTTLENDKEIDNSKLDINETQGKRLC